MCFGWNPIKAMFLFRLFYQKGYDIHVVFINDVNFDSLFKVTPVANILITIVQDLSAFLFFFLLLFFLILNVCNYNIAFKSYLY